MSEILENTVWCYKLTPVYHMWTVNWSILCMSYTGVVIVTDFSFCAISVQQLVTIEPYKTSTVSGVGLKDWPWITANTASRQNNTTTGSSAMHTSVYVCYGHTGTRVHVRIKPTQWSSHSAFKIVSNCRLTSPILILSKHTNMGFNNSWQLVLKTRRLLVDKPLRASESTSSCVTCRVH